MLHCFVVCCVSECLRLGLVGGYLWFVFWLIVLIFTYGLDIGCYEFAYKMFCVWVLCVMLCFVFVDLMLPLLASVFDACITVDLYLCCVAVCLDCLFVGTLLFRFLGELFCFLVLIGVVLVVCVCLFCCCYLVFAFGCRL